MQTERIQINAKINLAQSQILAFTHICIHTPRYPFGNCQTPLVSRIICLEEALRCGFKSI